jgi:ABC-type anion transport system duplicated permease subunit
MQLVPGSDHLLAPGNLAALQSVPDELHEAAKVDGASWWHRLRAVTIPGVRQVTTLISLLAIIISRASRASSARNLSATCQPTIRRTNKSVMNAV